MKLNRNRKNESIGGGGNGAPHGKALILVAFVIGYTVNGIFGVSKGGIPFQLQDGGTKAATTNIDEIVNGLQQSGDLFAFTHYEKDEEELMEEIRREQESGERDKFYLPKSYKARLDNDHYVDTSNTDGYQKEVYMAAMLLARRLVPSSDNNNNNKAEHGEQIQGNRGNRRGFVLDIGTGSGYKLVKFLSPEFKTVGFETEPAISFLRQKYPNETWVDSGTPEESLPESWNSDGKKPDICICSDVIEHIRNPDDLLRFLLSLQCKSYIISTPKRDVLRSAFWGPPGNRHHVREWTLHEFKLYLESQGFHVIKSFDGIQHASTQFAVAVPGINDTSIKKE